MVRILYERSDEAVNGDASVTLEGKGEDLLRALVQIIVGMESGCGLDVNRFCAALPALAALEKNAIDNVAKFDLNAIKKTQGGGRT